ncbi:MAG: sensor histidine kinase [Ancrocorticia populi]|uniref:sensor histidine kinase n=1 Tax=Ancrocorticia populi TaxID=2175228 RepID=UPI003F91A2DF
MNDTARLSSGLRGMRVGGGLVLGAGLLIFSLVTSESMDWSPLGLGILFGACAAVALSGLFPIVAACMLAVALPLVWFTPDKTMQLGSLSTFIVLLMLLWHRQRVAAAFFGVWYYVWSVVLMIPTTTGTELITGALVWAGLMAAFAVVGELLGRQLVQNEELEIRRRQELADQRQAIARELHDTVVYSTTMMVMRAEAAKLHITKDPSHPEAAQAPNADFTADLDFIANTGRRATADLRSMLAVLRMNDYETADAAQRFTIPQTSFDRVLTDQSHKVREAGLTVQMAVEGDLGTLPEEVASALSMIVTEACSNMVKHAARDVPATIMIEVNEDAVEGAFVNGLATARSGKEGPGYGLVGVQERAEALGGTVDISTTDSRWIIRISIPTKR